LIIRCIHSVACSMIMVDYDMNNKLYPHLDYRFTEVAEGLSSYR